MPRLIAMLALVAALLPAGCGAGAVATPTVAPDVPAAGDAQNLGTDDRGFDDPVETAPTPSPVAVTLKLQPATIAVGETAEVVLSVADVTDLYGVEAHLRFEPTLLQAVESSGEAESAQLEHGGLLKVGFTVVNALDNATGTVDYAIAQMPPSKAVSGSGDLLRFWVRGDGTGVASVQIESIILASAAGESIPLVVDVSAATLVIK
jgi:hypothetical protein